MVEEGPGARLDTTGHWGGCGQPASHTNGSGSMLNANNMFRKND